MSDHYDDIRDRAEIEYFRNLGYRDISLMWEDSPESKTETYFSKVSSLLESYVGRGMIAFNHGGKVLLVEVEGVVRNKFLVSVDSWNQVRLIEQPV